MMLCISVLKTECSFLLCLFMNGIERKENRDKRKSEKRDNTNSCLCLFYVELWCCEMQANSLACTNTHTQINAYTKHAKKIFQLRVCVRSLILFFGWSCVWICILKTGGMRIPHTWSVENCWKAKKLTITMMMLNSRRVEKKKKLHKNKQFKCDFSVLCTSVCSR